VARWQAINDVLRDDHIFCKSPGPTVIPARNSEHLPTVAEINLSAQTMPAFATVDGGIESDAIAFCESGYALANLCNRPGGFMSHYDRRDAAS